ncbi:MAG TPA: circadian clock KaiB family protein [Gaiellaceae bacterium]|jgi:circadian clock protein KaiB|nr:circadian clock KaiB family protein [Gaiellaceae bacterium]
MGPWKTPEATREGGGAPPPARYLLRLFVAGMTPRSTLAVANIRSICERYLSGAYELDVVNLYETPASAASEQIVAAPTCVRHFPLPPKRIVGDMSNTERVIAGLQLSIAR